MATDERRPPVLRRSPWPFRILLWVVLGTGVVSLATGAVAASGTGAPAAWRLILAAGLFALGDVCVLRLRFGHNSHSFSWSETAMVVGLVLVPGPWLRVVAPLAVAAAHAAARRPPLKIAFNAMSIATEAVLAAAVLAAVAPAGEPVTSPRLWAGLAAASLSLFVWGGVTVSAAVAFSQCLPLRQVYAKGLPVTALVWAGNTALGLLLVGLSGAPASLVAVPLVVLMLHLAYRTYLGAMNERDTWELLETASGELLRADARVVAGVVLDRVPALFRAEYVELLVTDGEAGEHAAVYRRDGHAVEEERGDAMTVAQATWLGALRRREIYQLVRAHAPGDEAADLAARGLEACAVAPLLSPRGCVGVLRIGFRGEVLLGERELQVLTTFANHLGSALHNTSLIEELRAQALRDPLTGLPNRSLMLDRLSQALKRMHRRPGGVAVLFCDVDRFKVVNDSLGHPAGDELLVAVARRLEQTVRVGDTATRFGGDEFVVVCEDIGDDGQAADVAGRLSACLAEPFRLRGDDIYVTVSIGVAVSDDPTEDPAALVRDADAAMYEAKAKGRSCCVVFDDPMRERAVARLEVENDLRRAIERGELRVHYQPNVSIDGLRVVGAEALVRWERPGRGLVSPLEFIALAEETGLIVPLGRFVLDEACRQLSAWLADGLVDDSFVVSVNLSAHQLRGPGVLEDVHQALRASGLDSRQLCIEVTESALVDQGGSSDTIRSIHAMGVRIAIDDFGTGYSALSYLHMLPVEILKIDRSFVGRLGLDPRDRALITGVIDLAHGLGLKVVAEGVERADQLGDLASMACDIAQGFYFAKPQAATAMQTLLRQEAGLGLRPTVDLREVAVQA
ncbi:MAG TPA: EAL domain-containing protein [Acidimicrobiales bacterium]|nr:EAL domain-containing protein [Acidimicrobiales bacterium]